MTNYVCYTSYKKKGIKKSKREEKGKRKLNEVEKRRITAISNSGTH